MLYNYIESQFFDHYNYNLYIIKTCYVKYNPSILPIGYGTPIFNTTYEIYISVWEQDL